MELGKPSNLGSLVSAVLVGLLALASNQYAKMDPRALNELFGGTNTVPTSVTTDAPAPPSAAPGAAAATKKKPKVTVAAIRRQAASLERELFALFGRWKAHALPENDQKLARALQATSKLTADLQDHAELHEQLTPDDLLMILRINFIAAEVDRGRFHEPFMAIADRLLESGRSPVAAQAAALYFFHTTDLTHPDVPAILEALRAFSEQYPHPGIGISFYLQVANELRAKRHLEVAIVVVRQGAETYSGQPGHYDLVRWLIDFAPSRSFGK